MLRTLLIVLLVAVPCVVQSKTIPHHTNENVFIQLFSHVMPAWLMHPDSLHHDDGGHGDEGHGDEAASHGAEEEPLLVAHGATGDHGVGEHYLFSIPLPAFLTGFAANQAELAADPHATPLLVPTNLQLFQIAAVLILLVAFSGVPRYLRTGRGDYPSRLLAGFCMWIRDEMVYAQMGKETGRKFLPFFLTMFFFVAFMNLFGLIPGSATPTASVFVTAGMALITLAAMLICGMVVQGPVAFWKNLVPHVPVFLWPLMFAIEIISLLVKPFALTVRLFANMTGGHLVLLSLMGLIFFFGGKFGAGVGYGASPGLLVLAVFIMIIESFVALMQAYIFTQLSIIFVQNSIHPDH
jgi:F-type H+-transporting ATPase subunit a